MSSDAFKKQILEGIPDKIPPARDYDQEVNHAPRRRDILSAEEKKLALRNALRYKADVLFYKDHGFFFFMHRRFMHPKFLLMLLFPFLILVDFRLKSIADFMFVPQFYLYLLVLRLVIWKNAAQEKVFVL